MGKKKKKTVAGEFKKRGREATESQQARRDTGREEETGSVLFFFNFCRGGGRRRSYKSKTAKLMFAKLAGHGVDERGTGEGNGDRCTNPPWIRHLRDEGNTRQ